MSESFTTGSIDGSQARVYTGTGSVRSVVLRRFPPLSGLTPVCFAAEFAPMISSCARLLVLLLSLSRIVAADWPQWRGPAGTGHVPAGVPVPQSLPAEPQAVWRIKVGDGLASPVVAGGKVFFLDNQTNKETVHALDAASGRALWSVPLDDAFKDSQSLPGPRCTPTVDGDRVYAQSCKGELQCLNAATGKLIWRVHYVKDLEAVFIGEKGQAAGASRHGYNGAPIVDGPHLIAGAGGTNGASVVCFDKLTGKIVWKSQSDLAAYAPPILATLAGVKQVVRFTVEGVMGLNRADGQLLWRVPLKTTFARHVTTPVVIEDMVMVASHQHGLLGVKVSKDGSGLKAEQAWLRKESAINFASPVAVDGHLYGIGPAKNIICVDPKTGEQKWSKAGYFTSGADKAHASFVVMGKNILILTDGGQLVLIAADPKECREISRAQVCGNTWCNPAYAGGRLFVRDAKELVCAALMP